ncbi:MAG: hypothetical protein KIS76_17125 [Pyrinomonadaceae bacterium]|nr:hypothetical protein [Pyrinomonadaceae bacterium]
MDAKRYAEVGLCVVQSIAFRRYKFRVSPLGDIFLGGSKDPKSVTHLPPEGGTLKAELWRRNSGVGTLTAEL